MAEIVPLRQCLHSVASSSLIQSAGHAWHAPLFKNLPPLHPVGASVGLTLGDADGDTDGEVLGGADGDVDGEIVGKCDGLVEGDELGNLVGFGVEGGVTPGGNVVQESWSAADVVPCSHSTFTVAPSTTGHFQPAGQLAQFAAVPSPSPDQRPALQAAHVVCVSSYLPAAHAVHVVAFEAASVR